MVPFLFLLGCDKAEMKQDIHQATSGTEKAADKAVDMGAKAADVTKDAAVKAGEETKEAAEKTGDAAKKAGSVIGDKTKEAVHGTAAAVEGAAQKAKDATKK